MQLWPVFPHLGPALRHRPRCVATLILLSAAGAATGSEPAPDASVVFTVSDLRSAQGQVLACLVNKASAFPDCSRDPAAHKLAVPVTAHSVRLDFGPVPPGTYAVAVVHDENGNGRMDKRLFMPREGFGFSRDAAVRMGPPSFGAAAFAVGAGAVHHRMKMRYMF